MHGFYVCLHSHHEEYSWYNETGVSCIAKERPHESRQVQVNRLHDHVKHLVLSTANNNSLAVFHISKSLHVSHVQINICAFYHLKGPQSNEGGSVMIV